MHPQIEKLMKKTVGQRYEQLNHMLTLNDPKAILFLTDEWEYQTKISAILCAKLRADALAKRGKVVLRMIELKKIAAMADGIYENWDGSGPGIMVQEQRASVEISRKLIIIPIEFLGNGDERTILLEFMQDKNAQINGDSSTYSPTISMKSSTYIQDHAMEWDSDKKSGFNFFPTNINLILKDGVVQSPTREEIVRLAISAIVKRKNFNKVTISRQKDLIFTMGSCFAAELHRSLIDAGLKAERLWLEESINTTHSNLLLLKSVYNEKLDIGLIEVIDETADINNKLRLIKSNIQKAKIVVITLGVAPIVINCASKKLVLSKNLKTRFESGEVEMKFSSVQENFTNIKEIYSILRILSPEIQIFFTLSPVPLIGVPSSMSVLERDVISKSTIRLAIDEAERELEIKYWPSFEVVKWLPPHVKPELAYMSFGDPDNNSRHVSRWLVDEITKAFIEHAIELKP